MAARKSRRPRHQAVADRVCEAATELTAERLPSAYAAQWIMVHDVAGYLGMSDEEVLEAIRVAGGGLACIGTPAHKMCSFGDRSCGWSLWIPPR
jgi:hypothetical protein